MAELAQLIIDEHYVNGLVPDMRTPVNTKGLLQCKGLKPTSMMLAVPEPITHIDFVSAVHPYPLVHSGRRGSYVFDDQAIYSYDEDNNVTGVLSIEHASNGTFTGNANTWSLGTGWAYAANNITHTAGTASTVTQGSTTQRAPVRLGRRYRVVYTISGMSAGSISIALGSSVGATRTANGTYTEDLVATVGTTITLSCTSAFNGTIDNVSVKALDELIYDAASAGDPQTDSVSNGGFVGNDDDWTSSGTWAYANNSMVHTAGSAATLSQAAADQAVAIVSGRLYRVRYTLSNVNAGSVTLALGTTSGTTRSADGTYEEDLIAYKLLGSDTIPITITPSSTFVGVIDSVSVKEIEVLTIPAGGGVWKVADFGDVFWAAKDAVTVLKVPYFSSFRLVGFTFATHDVKTPALANLGNRLLMSLDSLDLFNTNSVQSEAVRWQSLWRLWIESSPEYVLTHRSLAMGPNTLFYTTPSGGDYDNPFIQELGMLGFFARETSRYDIIDSYEDVIMKGELGFIPLPWQKKIVAIERLGNGAMIYCEDGMSYVAPTETGGMSHTEIKDVGIAQRGSVCGDERMHVFIDKVGWMWSIDAQLQLKRLGYRYLFIPMLAETIVASYDAEEGECYFTSETKCYIKTPTGVGEIIDKLPVSLIRVNDDLVGAYLDNNDDTFTVELYEFDMGMDMQKTVTTYGIAATDVTNLHGRLKYRNDRVSGDSGFKNLARILANRSNIIHPNAPGRDFRLVIDGTINGDTKIERTVITFRSTEKKSTVGVLDTNAGLIN